MGAYNSHKANVTVTVYMDKGETKSEGMNLNHENMVLCKC